MTFEGEFFRPAGERLHPDVIVSPFGESDLIDYTVRMPYN